MRISKTNGVAHIEARLARELKARKLRRGFSYRLSISYRLENNPQRHTELDFVQGRGQNAYEALNQITPDLTAKVLGSIVVLDVDITTN